MRDDDSFGTLQIRYIFMSATSGLSHIIEESNGFFFSRFFLELNEKNKEWGRQGEFLPNFLSFWIFFFFFSLSEVSVEGVSSIFTRYE